MTSGVARAIGMRAALVVVYALAAAIGRASVVGGDPHALVWPAGGLAVGWLLTHSSKRDWTVDIPLLISVGMALSFATGRDVATTVVLAIANIVAVMTIVLVGRHWSQDTIRQGLPPTDSPHAMGVFLLSVVGGSSLGVVAGAGGLWVIGSDPSPMSLVVWFGRNVCGVAAVGMAVLLIIDRIRRGRRTVSIPGSWQELALLFCTTAALIVADFASELPVSLLLPAAAVWAGSRFTALAAAIHAVVGGAGVLWLTYSHHGPFSAQGDARTEVLLAQLFVAMTLTIGLMLASAREARAALQAHLLAQEREQSAELLTFARRAAHDLRNPLSVVASWTAELAATLSANGRGRPGDTATMINGIERATAHMRNLVDALLADASARDRAPHRQQVDLPELVREIATEYDAANGVRTLGVRTVSGDPVLVRQLVENVVANAVKYVRPGQPPEVTVSARRAAGRIVVRVTDNGIGIPPGQHEWIFEPFHRAHDDAYPGTGLGLSTCRRIVERHGGSMRALPREDGPGSVFEFDLPEALATAEK